MLYHQAGYITTANAGYIWGSPIVGNVFGQMTRKVESEGGLRLNNGCKAQVSRTCVNSRAEVKVNT